MAINPYKSLNNYILSEKNIWVKRPSGGDFPARDYDSLLGKIAKNKITSGYQIKSADINL
jgi:sialic acid synthase SpsE